MISKRKIEIVEVEVTNSTKSVPIHCTNWDLCLICQEDTNQPLKCPNYANGSAKGIGYTTLSHIFLYTGNDDSLVNINTRFCVQTFDEARELENTFRLNNAKYHKNCRTTLENLKRREHIIKKPKLEDTNESGVSTRTAYDVTDVKLTCFFCDENEKNSDLVPARTKGISDRVKEAAILLREEKLIAKLSVGDMVAIEAKYHRRCLIKLYNKTRRFTTDLARQPDMDAIYYGIAISEVINYIEDIYDKSDILPVFKLADIFNMVTNRMESLGTVDSYKKVHRTRLKDTILAQIPFLRAHKEGREIVFVSDGDVGEVIFQALHRLTQDDGVCLSRAATIVRRDLFREFPKFNGSFSLDCQENSVPKSLLTLVTMIMEGSRVDSTKREAEIPTCKSRNLAALSCAQLIRFNSSKNSKLTSSLKVRHQVGNEPPLPLYIGLMVHAKTRKKGIVNKLASLGVCVSYQRTQDILDLVTNAACKRYKDENCVYPFEVPLGTFVTTAIDNLDYNPSSTTSLDCFHGVGISVITHPKDDIAMVSSIPLHSETFLSDRVKYQKLPDYYTHIPVMSNKCTEIHLTTVNSDTLERKFDPLHLSKSWLDMYHADFNGSGESVSWAAYYSQLQLEIRLKCPSFLLPLLHESISSPAMVRHTMDIIMLAIKKINPGQIPVVTGDQPVYAIAKQVQWLMPEMYGEDKLIVMMGSLHVEMAVLSMIGNWLDGSGWVEAMVAANVTTQGRGESALKCAHVKRTRYLHQVSIAALHILLDRAWNSHKDGLDCSDDISLDDWIVKKKADSVQFLYWHTVIHLEALMLTLVRSQREANFEMYVDTLIQVSPWMFALDHVNYARWLPIFVKTMLELGTRHPSVRAEFGKGHFVSQKTNRPFSSMGDDQIHEQNNKIVKIDGGAVGLFDSPAALLKWTVSGPQTARMLREFEKEFTNDDIAAGDSSVHHENSPTFEQSFRDNVKELVHVLEECGNPFETEDDQLISIMSKQIMSTEASKSVRSVFDLGQRQYEIFVKERLVEGSSSIHDIIHRNKLPLFRKKYSSQTKLKTKVKSLQQDCSLFSRMYISCQSREGDLDDFFSHENHVYPPSLSDFGELRSCTKSDALVCIEKLGTTVYDVPISTAIIIDGAAAVHLIKPAACRTLQEYRSTVFVPYILSFFRKASSIYVVFDRYIKGSLKSYTRQKRGSGIKLKINANTNVPKQWTSFLHDEDNKDALFKFLAEGLVEYQHATNTILTTHGETTLVSRNGIDVSELQPCTHEEADTRIFLNAMHASLGGHRQIMIHTVDTDVVVIAIHVFSKLGIEKLWICFGTGKHKRYLPIHEYSTSLGANKCDAIIYWFTFTGCDTVSSFLGRGKKTAWDTWLAFPEVSEAFIIFSDFPIDDILLFNILQRYTVLLYDRTSSCQTVNECRKVLFTKKNRPLENIPPTKEALIQHAKRASYQASVWRRCLQRNPQIPLPDKWGWKRKDDECGYDPFWSSLGEASKHCIELIHCGCKGQCNNNCKCARSALPCTHLCKCDGQCSK